MDRFKFRVWSKKNKEWLLNGFSLFGEAVLFGEWNKIVDKCLDSEYLDSLCVMQSTGLKDKNEKLIYEGDVIEYTRWKDECLAKIQWEEGCFILKLHGSIHGLNEGDVLLDGDVMNYPVIGNIYENPELLIVK